MSALRNFTDWLNQYGVKGYVGEVGWPNGPDVESWNAVAEAWYRAADNAGLWVTSWAASEWWQQVSLNMYGAKQPGNGLQLANPQAQVIERHPTADGIWRGVAVAGGDFDAPAIAATSTFSNATPGIYDRRYHYEPASSFRYLSSRGVRLVRVPFRWERLQPRLGAPLDATELNRLRGVVQGARDAGLRVILDLHNFGAYYLSDGTQGVRRTLGSPELPVQDFADFWTRLATAFHDDPTVLGYGLMNEPVNIETRGSESGGDLWRRSSQEAVNAIRATGDRHTLLISGYQWSGTLYWSHYNPRPWITDPLNDIRYEAHQYFDIDMSGTYRQSYADDVQMASGAA